MSVQFGKCNFDGKPVDPKELDQVRPVLAPYGPHGEGYICKDNFGLLYRAFHTTKESRLEQQPHLLQSGAAVTWDGRLDNREELLKQLDGTLPSCSTDLAIVAAAYERWATNAFAKLIGDWAVSICDPGRRSLILAKDFVGAKHLYYSVEKGAVTWCTILDPLILFADRSFALDEEYVAGWLAFFPASNLSPYVGIRAVPQSSFVRLQAGEHIVKQYWQFDPGKRIEYRTDGEYEGHFREVFGNAVRRRLRSDSPVLAELSGGMDSSSIVCMADQEIRRGQAETPRLDTLSYYDDTEPNWNERPYFTKVEATRGRSGWHIDVSVPEPLKVETDGNSLIASPASEFGSDAISKGLTACLKSQGNCVVLSGFGGDEVAGGVPTPIPELEDLLSQGDLQKLARQLKAWALNKRKPWLHLLSEAARRFLPSSTAGIQGHLSSAPWLNRRFMQRNRLALLGSGCRVKVFGPPPSFQENLGSLEVLGRQLSCSAVSSDPLYEKRYPYLDRDLLEFFYAVPREQLVRPGQRRSLVRRALIGIVPDEILNRRRKAYVARAPIATLSASLSSLLEMSQNMISHSFGFIDACAFREALQELTRNRDIPIVCLLRTIGVEFWLRNLVSSKLTPIATSENRSPAGCTYKNVMGHEQEKARRLRSSPVPNRNHRDKRNSTCKS